MILGVITVSDRGYRGERKDTSSEIIVDWFRTVFTSAEIIREIVPDEIELIEESLLKMCDIKKCSLVLTTGGTGFGFRDVTPEATKKIIEKEAPGISEFLRLEGLKKTPFSILSRGVSGIRGKTLVINLPGSEKAVKEGLDSLKPIIDHALQLIEKGSLECGRK